MSQIQYSPEPHELMGLQPGARIFIGPTFPPAKDTGHQALRQQIHVATVVKNSSNSRYFPSISASIPNGDGPLVIDAGGHIVQYPSQIVCSSSISALAVDTNPSGSCEDALEQFLHNLPKPPYIVSLQRIDITPDDRADAYTPDPVNIGNDLPATTFQVKNMAEYFQIDTCVRLDDGAFAFCSSAPRDDHELASTGIEKYYQLNIQSVKGSTPTLDDIQQLASELNIKLAEPKPARTMRMG